MSSRRIRAIAAACVLSFMPALQAHDDQGAAAPKDKLPSVTPAALAKLAEPWPDAEEMEARRVAAEKRPLFNGTDAVPVTLSADFKTINKDRRVEGKVPYPGIVTLAADGGTKTLHVKLRTRGHFRLRATSCSFVPLRVEFDKDEVAGTIFDGQKALKLITHCQSDREYEQYTMREYLTYRAFNLLTPYSFRARLSQVSYVQATDQKPIVARLGMFLEDDDDVARRMGGRVMDVPRALFKDVDQNLLTLAMAFEYMIGNTDFSIFALHNFRLIRTPDRKTFAVPYDFDMSGLVNARYALPDRAFGLKSVRDRMYRGPCRPLEEVEPVLSVFRTQKSAILALFDSLPDLTREQRRDARDYLDEFFRAIDRPGEVRSLFVSGRCSTKSTM